MPIHLYLPQFLVHIALLPFPKRPDASRTKISQNDHQRALHVRAFHSFQVVKLLYRWVSGDDAWVPYAQYYGNQYLPGRIAGKVTVMVLGRHQRLDTLALSALSPEYDAHPLLVKSQDAQ